MHWKSLETLTGLILLSTNRSWVLFETPKHPRGHLGAALGGHRSPSSLVLWHSVPCLWYPKTSQSAHVWIEILQVGFTLRLWILEFRCPTVGWRCRMGFCCLAWVLRVTVYMLEYLTRQLGAGRCGTGLTGNSSASGGADGSEVGYPSMAIGTSV